MRSENTRVFEVNDFRLLDLFNAMDPLMHFKFQHWVGTWSR